MEEAKRCARCERDAEGFITFGKNGKVFAYLYVCKEHKFEPGEGELIIRRRKP